MKALDCKSRSTINASQLHQSALKGAGCHTNQSARAYKWCDCAACPILLQHVPAEACATLARHDHGGAVQRGQSSCSMHPTGGRCLTFHCRMQKCSHPERGPAQVPLGWGGPCMSSTSYLKKQGAARSLRNASDCCGRGSLHGLERAGMRGHSSGLLLQACSSASFRGLEWQIAPWSA